MDKGKPSSPVRRISFQPRACFITMRNRDQARTQAFKARLQNKPEKAWHVQQHEHTCPLTCFSHPQSSTAHTFSCTSDHKPRNVIHKSHNDAITMHAEGFYNPGSHFALVRGLTGHHMPAQNRPHQPMCAHDPPLVSHWFEKDRQIRCTCTFSVTGLALHTHRPEPTVH